MVGTPMIAVAAADPNSAACQPAQLMRGCRPSHHRRTLSRRAIRSRALKVDREDGVRVERRREAVDLLGHVRRDEPLVVAAEGVGAGLELVVEAIALLLGEDAGLRPLAVGAAERDVPALR